MEFYIDVAMMVHPFPDTLVRPLANDIKEVVVEYSGKAAHAAAYPWEGVNALDAAVLVYNSMSVLRQQMKPTWRVHSIISKGGVKPNIIPEETEIEIYCRAPVVNELNVLVDKVNCCLNAAAQATGCTLNISENFPMYLDMQQNQTLAESFGQNWSAQGIQYDNGGQIGGSTDIGNVSYVVPSLILAMLLGQDN